MNIYISDDEESITDIISSFLTSNGYNTTTFDTSEKLFEQFEKEPSDMVILDIMTPGLDGITICSKIRKKHNVPIIIVSAKDTQADIINGITSGADDYLIKPFSPMELVVRVNAIFRRLAFIEKSENQDKLTYGDITIDIAYKLAYLKDEPLDLTPTEFAFVVYMFKNNDKAISREEILKNVWKFECLEDSKVCDDVLKRLRKKIHNSNVKITTVWGYGFKLEIGE